MRIRLVAAEALLKALLQPRLGAVQRYDKDTRGPNHSSLTAKGAAAQRSWRSVKERVTTESASEEAMERRRLQLIEYLKLPQVAEFEMARSLTLSHTEDLAVQRAQKKWLAGDRRRILWFEHLLAQSQLAEANELAVTPFEQAKLMRASALHARRTLGCVGSGMPLLEEERKRQLSDAIDSCAWNVAEVLALTETEVEAIATSKRRAELIHAARLRGKFDCALKLSVSDAERRAVENWRDRVNASLATVQLTSPATWKAAIRLQTLYRGSSARRLREEHRLGSAAVLLQKSYRGHAYRASLAEERRKARLQWHVEQGGFDEALQLVMCKEEQREVVRAQMVEQPRMLRCLACFEKLE